MFRVTLLAISAMFLPMRAPSAPLSPLHVDGKLIVDRDNRPIRLKGVAIPDPEHADLKRPGQSARSLIELAVTRHHATVIRIPVLPGDDGITGFFVDPEAYFQNYLLPAVQKCAELGVYAIVDLHYIADYLKLKPKVAEFWRFVTPRLMGYPHVLFEIFNEPIYPSDWQTWLTSIAQPTVDLIRDLGARNVLIVGGPEWSTQMAGAAKRPVAGGNIAYTAHVYPGHPRDSWDRNYGPLLDKFPVFVTEWGWEKGAPDKTVNGTTSDFGVPFRAWMDTHALSWTAWTFDNEWDAKMFNADWTLKGGQPGSGEFIVQSLGHDRATPQ